MAKRRRRLRPLVPKENIETKPEYSFQIAIYLAFLITGITAVIYFRNIDTAEAWTNFISAYRNQFHLIVRSEKDYCSTSMDAAKLISRVQQVVLNQQSALASIEVQLRNDRKFTAIGIVGSTGVGKSLFASALKENFPWQENVQMYSWSQYQPSNQKKEDVLTLLNYLSVCGRNLMVIDNFGLDDLDFLQEFNRYASKHVNQANVNLLVFYIFNVITFTDEQRKQYAAKIESLNELENVKLIKFRQFNANDLEDCIRQDARIRNLTLGEEVVAEISNMIDVESSGCKNVYPKLMLFAGREDGL